MNYKYKANRHARRAFEGMFIRRPGGITKDVFIAIIEDLLLEAYNDGYKAREKDELVKN